jgi:extracellular factor (EF) 3-hydroxypalmitic acid methyl ester biosynthesis protein
LYLRRQLHPYLLGSPFAMRAYTKPLGYAGDYGMVAMMLRSPAEGETLYAKLINCWLVSQAPAAAHRHRVAYLKEKLIEESVRVQALGRQLRVFNLGCGPADEVQQFLTTEPLSARVKMTLLDFNDETLAHLKGRLEEIQRTTRRGEGVKLIKKSVQQVLKESLRPARERPAEQYDYVYCAGLFDYLPDEVCKRLMNIFYEMLAPGGLLVATNVSAAMNESFPFRYSMEHMLDWHLIYRDGADFARVAPDHAATGDVRVIEEAIGVNIMLEVRKPDHG